ncbi:MAG: hypothetical protein LBI79_02010 [Nitrososphaerota archaeon]|nr:hypothetical protein [Nitrososphaerota archaeon]
MHRTKLVWFTAGVVVAVSIFLIAVLYLPNSLHHNTTLLEVNQAVKGQSEKQALTAAETIDYTDISSLERFEGPSEADAYIHPGTYLSYTWANFIDSEVIDYYQNRYDYQQKQKYPKSVTFTYNTNVIYIEQLHISNITQQQHISSGYGTVDPSSGTTTWNNRTITWNNITTVFYGLDKTTPLKTINIMNWDIFYKNQATFHKMPREFDVTFNNCYLVEMNLTYDEIYGPLAAFFVDKQQIVVLDHNFEPLWVSINPTGMFVA